MGIIKSHTRLVTLTWLTIMAGGVSLLLIPVLPAQAPAVFTATLEEWAYDRSGKLRLTHTGLHAVRGDGSTVRARNVKRPDNNGHVTQRNIIDLTHAEEISIDALT